MVLVKRVFVMVLVAVLLSGCFPSRPYPPEYRRAVPSGSVGTTAGIMSWEDYVKMPDGAFGVGAQEGRCNKP